MSVDLYLFFVAVFHIVAIAMTIVVFHELGHYIMAKFLGWETRFWVSPTAMGFYVRPRNGDLEIRNASIEEAIRQTIRFVLRYITEYVEIILFGNLCGMLGVALLWILNIINTNGFILCNAVLLAYMVYEISHGLRNIKAKEFEVDAREKD